MTRHLEAIDLLDLSIGTALSAHLESCPRCRAAADETEEAFHLLALSLDPVTPPPELRVRLLAAVAGPALAHAAALADLLDLPEPELQTLLAAVDSDTAAWDRLGPTIEHHPLALAPGREGGLLRVAAGTRFPYHRHLGDERMRVLLGSCTDSGGAILGPGDELRHAAGSAHGLTSHRGPPLVLAYVGAGTELLPRPSRA